MSVTSPSPPLPHTHISKAASPVFNTYDAWWVLLPPPPPSPIHTFPRQQVLFHMMHDECYFPLPPPLPHTHISKAASPVFNTYDAWWVLLPPPPPLPHTPFPRQQVQCFTECYPPNTHISKAASPVFNTYDAWWVLLPPPPPPPLPHTYISKATNLMFNVYGVQCRLPLNTCFHGNKSSV